MQWTPIRRATALAMSWAAAETNQRVIHQDASGVMVCDTAWPATGNLLARSQRIDEFDFFTLEVSVSKSVHTGGFPTIPGTGGYSKLEAFLVGSPDQVTKLRLAQNIGSGQAQPYIWNGGGSSSAHDIGLTSSLFPSAPGAGHTGSLQFVFSGTPYGDNVSNLVGCIAYALTIQPSTAHAPGGTETFLWDVTEWYGKR